MNKYVKTQNNIIVALSNNAEDGFELKEGYKNSSFVDIGFSVDDANKGFVPPKPFDSWIYSEESCIYLAPEPYPAQPDKSDSFYWDEDEYNAGNGGWVFLAFEGE